LSAGGEEHAESVVGEVAVAMGEARAFSISRLMASVPPLLRPWVSK
jgi:hypothetical protein